MSDPNWFNKLIYNFNYMSDEEYVQFVRKILKKRKEHEKLWKEMIYFQIKQNDKMTNLMREKYFSQILDLPPSYEEATKK